MREHDARLLPAATASLVSCAVAAATGRWDAMAKGWAAAVVVAAVAALITSVSTRRGRDVRRRTLAQAATAVALMCGISAAVTGAAALAWHRDVPPWAQAPGMGRSVTIEGTVVSDARSAGRDAWSGERRWSVVVDAAWACVEPCAQERPVRMSVDVVGDLGDPPRLGDRVRVEGRAGPSRDTRRAATLWEGTVTTVGEPDALLAAVAHVRDLARVAARGLPDPVRGLTLGMTIGDTDQMPVALEADMRTAGLTHLTAVSGSHFAIVTLVMGAALRRVVRSRALRALLLAAGMSALAALVLPEPSVLRALTMAVAVALGWWWGRPARAVPALSAGVLALLLIQPEIAGAVGLQLSAVAVIAIVAWSPRLAIVLGRWMLAPLARAISVPLSVWLSCWPLLVMLRPGVGPYAVAANLVAGVAAFPITVLGLVATAVSMVWMPAGRVLMGLAGLCAWPVAWAAQAFAAAPGAWIAWPDSAAGVALAVAVTVSLVVATASDRMRPAARLAVTLVAVVLAGLSPAWTVTARPALDDWTVVACDVGQGDMTLVRVDEHSAVVIDTGPAGGKGAECLARYAVTTVVLLVLTHPHADHDGAVLELAAIARIEAAWVSPVATTPGHDVAAVDAASAGIDVSVAHQGQVFSRGDVWLEVLYPPTTLSLASSSGSINDASITLFIRAGPLTVLALGDLERSGQDEVARLLGGPVTVDLIKVAHHGSASQSMALAALVTARVASISVGAGNAYGHPDPGAMRLYAQRAIVVLTTERCGDIALGDDASVGSGCPSSVAG